MTSRRVRAFFLIGMVPVITMILFPYAMMLSGALMHAVSRSESWREIRRMAGLQFERVTEMPDFEAEALAEDLKKIYRAETQTEAEQALQNLRKRWGQLYPKIVTRWETKAYALLAFFRHPKPIRKFIYTTNQLERLAKEIKRRTKVVEVFCSENAVEKLLFLILSQINQSFKTRRLHGFAEAITENGLASQTQ